MRHRVALVRTDDSEERIFSIIKVTRIGELGTIMFLRHVLRLLFTANVVHPNDGEDTFLRNVGSYKRHTALT
jgi:hypothetical protein